MTNARTRLHTLIAMVVAIVVLVGCGSKTASQAIEKPRSKQEPAAIEGLKQPGVLTVGLRSSVGAPFVFESSKGLSGLDVELGCALADELGLSVSFKKVNDVARALQDECDIILNVATSEANGFNVLGDYAESALSVFHRGDPTVVSVEDLNNKVVALQNGSSAQMGLRLTALQMSELACNSLTEAFQALDEGRADYVLCYAPSGAYLSSWRDDVSFAGTFEEPTVLGIALASGDGAAQGAVRSAYERIASNGILAEERRSWLGNMPVLTSASVIANIPMRETTGEQLAETNGAGDEVLSTSLDGSTAGSNAVTVVDSSNNESTTDSESSTYDTAPPYANQTYSYSGESYYGSGDYYDYDE